MKYDQLKLNNQLCFPVYAASRLITREYQPLLEKLGITYPQYLVLLVLWEKDGLSVNEISGKLLLNTNTLTPLLKRMEKMGIISRQRSTVDERKVLIRLSKKGSGMKEDAATIPDKLAEKLNNENLNIEKLIELRNSLNMLINILDKNNAISG